MQYFYLDPTFDADHVFSNLLGEEGVGDQLDEVVDGVDAGVDGLEPLDLLADGQRVGHVGGQVALVVGHDGVFLTIVSAASSQAMTPNSDSWGLATDCFSLQTGGTLYLLLTPHSSGVENLSIIDHLTAYFITSRNLTWNLSLL